jgi:hypothetical protein
MAIILICACFSLSGPWYSLREVWHANSTVLVSKTTTFFLYRDIQMQYVYEHAKTGHEYAKNTTTTSWDQSRMLELARVFHLCGPLLIVAVALDFVGMAIIVTTRFLNATENTQDDGCVSHCIFFRRRWILLFCGLLATSVLLNTISSFLFMASPDAFTHDLLAITGNPCTSGPCKSWSGHAPAGNLFRLWGPSFGWVISVALLGLRILPFLAAIVWRHLELDRANYTRIQ